MLSTKERKRLGGSVMRTASGKEKHLSEGAKVGLLSETQSGENNEGCTTRGFSLALLKE